MQQASDLIHIPYTPDLTESGITYACRSLAHSYHPKGSLPIDRMRRIVADTAVELAFRHYLGSQEIPFHVNVAIPFTDPDHHDVSLGGHRCKLISAHISQRRQIIPLRADPGRLLQSQTLIPMEQFAAEGQKPDEIQLFAFLLGVVATSREDTIKATAAGQPVFLLHPLPDEWAQPKTWVPLAPLALKSECANPVIVEAGGMDAERNFLTVKMELPPRKRVLVEQDFHSLAYIHVQEQPDARLGIHSPACGSAYIIPPHAWGNVWIYGMDIWLAGWLTHEEFRRKANILNSGQTPRMYIRPHTKTLSVPVRELNPCSPLFRRVKAWEAEKTAHPADLR
jgi:hypothetical protein